MKKIDMLKMKQIEYILNTQEYKDTLKELVNDITINAKSANNEASIVSIFELELFSFIKEVLNLKYYPEKEKSVNTERHVSKGRIDSKIGALIIEFKQPSSLKSEKQMKAASRQISEYLKGLSLEHKSDFIGIVTDGVKCQTITIEYDAYSYSGYEALSYKHLDLIIRNIVLLEKVALTPENLVKNFCNPIDNNISKLLTLTLYSTLKESSTGKSIMLFKEWKELFRLAHDDKSKQSAIKERRETLELVVNDKFVNQDDEYLALYSLQTTYAIIIKIIAYKVISKIRFDKSLIDFHVLSKADSASLQLQMNELEEGAIFRNLGIGNLLEGDFFAWYSSSEQWNDEIAHLIKNIFEVLTPYEDKAIFETGNNANDLFKDLFMHIIPDKVRHSLGEFYTPPWLADNLVSEAIVKSEKTEWKGLDPCSGSGTFLTVLIKKILEESKDTSKKERLKSVLNRVKGIDLNPLAVLTARINYFINISPLISDDDIFEIPVYLGDSSYVPNEEIISDVICLSYKIQTIKGEIEIYLPKSTVRDSELFSKVMTSIEDDVHNLDEQEIVQKLLNITPKEEQTEMVVNNLNALAFKLVELERNDWNGIWVRIITNFLTTANLGYFDIIVGNPPWIDWKNLPAGYRDRIKDLCVDRHLFSGDGRTGGINLNICALISNVSVQNWLNDDGILAFLMPQTLISQQTYEGFREFNLDNNKKLYLQEVYDWTKAGHPFKPVQQKFLTYFFSSKKINYQQGVNVKHYIKNHRETLDKYKNINDYDKVSHIFKISEGFIGQVNKQNTIFTYADNKKHLLSFEKISGSTLYRGREGVEFYPQELYLLEIDSSMPKTPKGKIFVKNFQNIKSKYKIPQQTFLLETKYLHPLIKGVNIKRFHIEDSNFIVPFPYEKMNTRSPIDLKKLTKESKLLSQYFNKFKKVINEQSDYTSKIIGEKHKNEFYALARVGDYSFADNYVVFRDNTKWVSAVVSKVQTPWGELKRPQFQNHAVSICQDDSGRFISLDEAHFICAVMNAPLTNEYVVNSSDSRSFKIRPQINIPIYDINNPIHKKLSKLSKTAHIIFDNEKEMKKIDKKLDELVVKLK